MTRNRNYLIKCSCGREFWRTWPCNPKTLRPYDCPASQTCADCKGKPRDYRNAYGHLTIDDNGRTVLVKHTGHRTRLSTLTEQMAHVAESRKQSWLRA